MTRPYSQRGNREHEATPRGDPMRPARNQGGRSPLKPDTYCPDCSRTDQHTHCPECGSTEHAAADCDLAG